MPFTEANYENAVLSLFTDILGYTNIYELGGIDTWPYEIEP